MVQRRLGGRVVGEHVLPIPHHLPTRRAIVPLSPRIQHGLRLVETLRVLEVEAMAPPAVAPGAWGTPLDR